MNKISSLQYQNKNTAALAAPVAVEVELEVKGIEVFDISLMPTLPTGKLRFVLVDGDDNVIDAIKLTTKDITNPFEKGKVGLTAGFASITINGEEYNVACQVTSRKFNRELIAVARDVKAGKAVKSAEYNQKLLAKALAGLSKSDLLAMAEKAR